MNLCSGNGVALSHHDMRISTCISPRLHWRWLQYIDFKRMTGIKVVLDMPYVLRTLLPSVGAAEEDQGPAAGAAAAAPHAGRARHPRLPPHAGEVRLRTYIL